MNEDKMIETLKQEYLGMRFVVEFEKLVLNGIAKGLTISEKMNFVDWNDACDWARSHGTVCYS